MNNIINIIKKELIRFFKDRRLLISVLLPGVMIFVLYSFIGNVMSTATGVPSDYVSKVYYVGEIPSVIIDNLDSMKFNGDYKKIDATEVESIKTKIKNKEIDLLIIFPDNFDPINNPVGNVEIFYNTTRTESSNAYNSFNAILDQYSIIRQFKINDGKETYNLATQKDTSGMIISMLLPLLILTFLFSGCLAVTPESISGEKERGTIATLLVTPIKRSELAIGKIISLSIIALTSAISSAIGTFLALPKLMQGQGELTVEYVFTDYLGVLLVIIAAVLFIVSVIAIISTYAKSVKEATSLAMPLMIVVMLIGVSSMLGISGNNILYYFIPLFNVTQCLIAITTFNINWVHILVTVGSLLAYTFILIYVLVKMFNNEKIIFNK